MISVFFYASENLFCVFSPAVPVSAVYARVPVGGPGDGGEPPAQPMNDTPFEEAHQHHPQHNVTVRNGICPAVSVCQTDPVLFHIHQNRDFFRKLCASLIDSFFAVRSKKKTSSEKIRYGVSFRFCSYISFAIRNIFFTRPGSPAAV